MASGKRDPFLGEWRIFTWESNEEYNDVSGCGWAVVEQDELRGCLYFHAGDDSAFRAIRRRSKAT
jgi:hypothetical protein